MNDPLPYAPAAASTQANATTTDPTNETPSSLDANLVLPFSKSHVEISIYAKLFPRIYEFYDKHTSLGLNAQGGMIQGTSYIRKPGKYYVKVPFSELTLPTNLKRYEYNICKELFPSIDNYYNEVSGNDYVKKSVAITSTEDSVASSTVASAAGGLNAGHIVLSLPEIINGNHAFFTCVELYHPIFNHYKEVSSQVFQRNFRPSSLVVPFSKLNLKPKIDSTGLNQLKILLPDVVNYYNPKNADTGMHTLKKSTIDAIRAAHPRPAGIIPRIRVNLPDTIVYHRTLFGMFGNMGIYYEDSGFGNKRRKYDSPTSAYFPISDIGWFAVLDKDEFDYIKSIYPDIVEHYYNWGGKMKFNSSVPVAPYDTTTGERRAAAGGGGSLRRNTKLTRRMCRKRRKSNRTIRRR
jgi:hypothetical protein